MFSSGFHEAGNGTVTLPELSFETLYAVIKFIYTGKVEVSVSTAVGSYTPQLIRLDKILILSH
jgi:hypothetical protein